MVARDRTKPPPLRVGRAILSLQHTRIGAPWRENPESTYGGQGQNRTADTGIFSPLLYRLSYLATGALRQPAIRPNTGRAVNHSAALFSPELDRWR